MNLKKIPLVILGVTFLALAGIAGYIAFMDVPIGQTQVVKTIPNSRFFGNGNG